MTKLFYDKKSKATQFLCFGMFFFLQFFSMQRKTEAADLREPSYLAHLEKRKKQEEERKQLHNQLDATRSHLARTINEMRHISEQQGENHQFNKTCNDIAKINDNLQKNIISLTKKCPFNLSEFEK